MNGGEMGNSAKTQTMLKEAGFTISEECNTRQSCFNFVARKDKNLILIKTEKDIDLFSSIDADELKKLGECTSAALVIVGEKTRERPLEDDTVYTRYDIAAVTPKTFENVALRKIYPLIQAGPGGYYVEIDGAVFKKQRQELGFSMGELAEIVGLSRRTLYGYERGMAKASVPAAYKLTWALGIPIAKPMHILDRPRVRQKCFLATAKQVIAKNKLLQRLFNRFNRCRVVTFRKAPFDFVINVRDEPLQIVGGVASEKEQLLDRRIDEILSVSDVFQAYPILITQGQKQPERDIVCIPSEELSKVHDPMELVENFT